MHPDEFFGGPISMDFFSSTAGDHQLLEADRFVIQDVVERGPYAPEVGSRFFRLKNESHGSATTPNNRCNRSSTCNL